jgi:hypothetical protein
VKLNSGLHDESNIQHEKNPFFGKFDFNFNKELVKCCIWSIALFVLNLGKQIRNTWKVLKCGAREEWRRSFERIV